MRPEPPPGSVITFVLFLGETPYTFAALHVGGLGWYLTRGQWPNPVPWARLDLLIAGPVHVATGWAQLPEYPPPY